MIKTKHGGKRPGAGRKKMKPVDKKVRITVWPTGSVVKRAGGPKAAKLLAIKAIEECKSFVNDLI